MEKLKIAIIIPAFNEENTISRVINSIKSYGIPIVVNDASTDRTETVANDAGAIVINHIHNEGYDKSLDSGFKKADALNCNYVVTFDADGQHDSNAIPLFINELKNGFDLVLGFRTKKQRFSELLFSFFTRNRLGWRDPLCGMKGYNIKLYKELGYFDSYNSIGTELAFFGILNGYSFIELHVPIFHRSDHSRFTSISANFKILKSLLKLIFTN
jgi:glycosyltransferase involved in cell wall biosynthesis